MNLVLRNLDRLKKDEATGQQARQAIRYLERRTKFPSPFIRVQRQDESVEADILMEMDYQSIWSCCSFFKGQGLDVSILTLDEASYPSAFIKLGISFLAV